MKIYHLKEFSEFMNEKFNSLADIGKFSPLENDKSIKYKFFESKVNLERLKKSALNNFINDCLDNYYNYIYAICIFKLNKVLILD
jgi:uncharacterized membrane protein YukC